MSEFATRNLRKPVEDLSVTEKQFLDRFTCAARDCGKDFLFEISKGAQDQTDKKKRRYNGRCGFCGKHIKLTDAQYARWRSLINGSELRVVDTTFDQFFSIS